MVVSTRVDTTRRYVAARRTLLVALCAGVVGSCSVESPSQPIHLPLAALPGAEAVAPLSNTGLMRALAGFHTTQPESASVRRWRSGLLAHLAAIAQVGPGTRPELFPTEADVVSYFVNAHMAWTLALNQEPLYRNRSLTALRETAFILEGRQVTLSSLAAEVLSRAPAEPRFVLFLNPGAAAGPPLPPWPLEGHALAWQLSTHASVCGADPSFWRFDEDRRELTVSPFAVFMPGLPAAAADRVVRLLDLVPPPPEMRTRILTVCGQSLQRCACMSADLDLSRWEGPPGRPTPNAGATAPV